MSLLLTTLFFDVLGTAGASAAQDSQPTVNVKNGTNTGYFAPAYNTDNFLGISYAQPPTGALRYRVPQSLNTIWTGSKQVTGYSADCYGYGNDTIYAGNNEAGNNDAGNVVAGDCLYLNIFRPANVSAPQGLPVAVWIHGGGLIEGGGPDPRYNPSFIVQRSAEFGAPAIGVSLNHRLSAWGFLYSQQLQDTGNSNLGFGD